MENGNNAADHAAMSGTTRQYSVADAARILGIGERAVRWRLQVGTLEGARTRQGWRVTLPHDAAIPAAEHGNGAATSGNAAADHGNAAADDGNLVAELRTALTWERERVRYLEAALQAEQERVREAHLLLAQRPALPTPSTTGAPASATHEPADRPWWAAWWPWRRSSVEV
jgi:hypothetical protein